MQQNFTLELLVKHLYHETNAAEAQIVENALAKHPTFHDEFTALQDAKFALDEDNGTLPNATILKNIMEYAKHNELIATH